MEKIFKQTLVEQAKLRHISVRSIHQKIEELCERDPSHQWFAESTLERRFRQPETMSSDEAELVRLALREIMTQADLVHARNILTKRQRAKAEEVVAKAVELGYPTTAFSFLTRETVQMADEFDYDVLNFYRKAPKSAKKFWKTHLPTYLQMPNLAKAAVMCTAYIGKVLHKDRLRNEKIRLFLDYFPFYDNCMVIDQFSSAQIQNLGGILSAVAAEYDRCSWDVFRPLAYDKDAHRIDATQTKPKNHDEKWFLTLARSYRSSVTDYSVTSADFAHTACFILFIDRTEWLLSYASSIFANKQLPEKAGEYYDKGCTGFRFTGTELGYLCELVLCVEGVR